MRLLAISLILLGYLALQPGPFEGRECSFSDTLATVKSCYDGDTCTIITTQGWPVRVRLVGIDAPERKGKNGAQPLANKAKMALSRFLVGFQVEVRAYSTDRYGRLLAELVRAGKSANLMMVQSGLAQVYRGKGIPPQLEQDKFLRLEAEARRNKVGIWSYDKYITPKKYRRLSKNL